MVGSGVTSRKQPNSLEFRASHAVVIGINEYRNGIQPLFTPVNDATRLAALLEQVHGYQVHLLTSDVIDVNLCCLQTFFTEALKPLLGPDDRLLVYYAGHGVNVVGDDGPQGFLVPQDADQINRDSLLPMTLLHKWLEDLPCRHLLVILDCCFAGAFRWSGTRSLPLTNRGVIHQERFNRFMRSRASQVLTSAAYNEEALDVIQGGAAGQRGVTDTEDGQHSPFALALFNALAGEGDLIPERPGDGVITATEMYLYLRDQVELGVQRAVDHQQTPGLWQLKNHDRGEFFFLNPKHPLNLPAAAELTADLNPWLGLKSYEKGDKPFYFGRNKAIKDLFAKVAVQAFTPVLGASGTGKSSLVKAGLLPRLAADTAEWEILGLIRPGAHPVNKLNQLLAQLLAAKLPDYAGQPLLERVVAAWAQKYPGRKLLLVVDQLEELVTLAGDTERTEFLAVLAEAVVQQPDAFRLVVTLRTDFEPLVKADSGLKPLLKADSGSKSLWDDARFIVPPLTRPELQEIIEGPAAQRVLYFEPPELVDTLIDEVDNTPGALPLLSFTLSEMFIQYVESDRDDRSLTEDDYEKIGRVIGSLRNRANKEYDSLDSAHKATMARVMLRMISVEGGELARRRVHRSELIYPSDAENTRVKTVLDRLVAARLLVIGDGPVVEPAHDALVLAWDQLLLWKKAADAYLSLQRQAAEAVSLWTEAAPDDKSGMLWDDDPRLPLLEETLWPTGGKRQSSAGRLRWAKQVLIPNTAAPDDTSWLNCAELKFVQASVKERSNYWLRLTLGVIVFIVIVSIVGVIAALGWKDAAEQASIAEYQARQSRSRELAALSDQTYLDDPNQSILMAVEAITTTYDVPSSTYTSEAFGALQRRLSSPLLATLDLVSDVSSAHFAPSGKHIIFVTFGGGLEIWDGTSYSRVLFDTSHNEVIELVVFNPAGDRMITQSKDQVTVWNTNGWEALHTYAVDGLLGEWLEVSGDGRYVAEKTRGQIKVYSTDNRDKEIIEQFDLNQGFREPFAFIDGQEKAHISLAERDILVVDLKSGTRKSLGLANEPLLADLDYGSYYLAGDPDEKALLIVDGALYILTSTEGRASWNKLENWDVSTHKARLSPSGNWVLFYIENPAMRERYLQLQDISSNAQHLPLGTISIDDVILSAGEKRAIVNDGTGALVLVDLESPNTRLQVGFSVSHYYDPETDRLYSIAQDGVLSIWNVGEGAIIEQIADFAGEVQEVGGDDSSQMLTIAGNTAYLWELNPGNLLHELANVPYDYFSEIGSYDPARAQVLISAGDPIERGVLLWEFSKNDYSQLASVGNINEFLSISPTQDSFNVLELDSCYFPEKGFCHFVFYRINEDHSLTVARDEGTNVVVNPDGSWSITNGMTWPVYSPDGHYLLIPRENNEIAFHNIADSSEIGRIRPKAGDRTHTSMGFPNSTTLEVKDALGGLIRFDLAWIATMESWDEARDELEIGRLSVENDRLCWQIDGLVESDTCVNGVKDFRGPLLDLDNNWERLVVRHDDNALCFHSMVDSSDPNCLPDVIAYALLSTDPLLILHLREDGIAVWIDESGKDLPVECPGVLPETILSNFVAAIGSRSSEIGSEIGDLSIEYRDESGEVYGGDCFVDSSSEYDLRHFRYSWWRIPNSDRYLLKPLDPQGPFIIRDDDEEIVLQGRSDGSFAFHPSGDFIVTGEKNGIINLWDSRTGALLHSFPAHSGSIRKLQVNETSIVSSTDDEIRIWRLVTDIDEMVAAAMDISQSYR